ncbi:MAG: hypothetical protein NTX50_00410 [Candidatus Sumerlaeota bacterium]|nr:hypothetical protein [Candidatus Sumerlaeota bacterium]
MARLRFAKGADPTLIVSALLVAFFIWLIAKQGEMNEVTLTAPIKIDKINPRCNVVYEPTSLLVRVQYPISLRSRVTNESFAVNLDVDDADTYAGIDDYKVNPLTITLSDVKPVGDLPTEIRPIQFMGSNRVTLKAQLNTCKVDIDVRTSGKPKPGYELAGLPKPEDPELFRLVGSREEFFALLKGKPKAVIPTEPVDLAGLSKSDIVRAPLIVPAGFKLARKDRDQKILPHTEWAIWVNVPISEETTTRTIDNIPVDARAPLPNSEIKCYPPTVSVTVWGVRGLVEKLSYGSFVIKTDLPLPGTTTYEDDVALVAEFAESISEKTRENLNIISLDPKKVRITIKPKTLEKDGVTSGGPK